jgi:hypothetical protein
MNLARLRWADERLDAELPKRFHSPSWALAVADSALRAVSPFLERTLPQVDANALIDSDLEDRIRFTGQAILVTSAGRVAGLLTSQMIQAAILQRLMRRSVPHHLHRLRVAELMRPWPQVSTLRLSWMSVAHVDDLLAVFSLTDSTHVVVVDGDRQHIRNVCGWVSRTELLRRLHFGSRQD